MALPIQNYTPQAVRDKQKRQAFRVWCGLLAIFVAWVAAIVAAPLLKLGGINNLADPIYSFFSYICHQISERSFHIHEHQLAVCARCFGFYAGFLGGIAVYPFVRAFHDTDSFPRFWLFAAMIPMGIDFFLTFFGVWENTHLSRVITGAILGAACAFFIIPALVEINLVLRAKLGRQKPSF